MILSDINLYLVDQSNGDWIILGSGWGGGWDLKDSILLSEFLKERTLENMPFKSTNLILTTNPQPQENEFKL